MIKLLIVDDSEVNLYVLHMLLEANGYQVVTAANGAKALEKARQNLPDLIITDILMPVMDGFTLCREWKKDEVLRNVPFVFYTATYTDPKDEKFALSLGAERFIIKPAEPSVFVKILKEVIEKGKSNQLIAPQDPVEDEGVYLKEYNEALIRKLESKMLQLEQKNRELEQDISERIQAEEALEASKQQYRIISETAIDGIITINEESNILFANSAVENIFGYSASEIMGQRITLLMPEYLRHIHRASLKRYIETGEKHISWKAVELPGLHKTGRDIPMEISFSEFIKDGKRTFTGIIRDITGRKETERALRQAEEKYRSIFENAVEGIFQYTSSGRIITANPAMARMLGYESPEEMVEALCDSDIEQQHYVEPERRMELRRLLEEEGTVQGFELQVRRNDGGRIWVSESVRAVRNANGDLIYFEGALVDITERKHLEEQLRQSQKMEAIGRLAGGVAHDFNNLLTAILGYSQLVMGRLAEGDPMRNNIEEITKAGERASLLTNQLLAFSRKQVRQPRVLDLNSAVADMEKMLRRIIREDIELITSLNPEIAHVKADPGQIGQVIINLVVNARDSMPEGGKLIIETANADLDEAYARRHVAARSGSYVMLAVSDTGMGMDTEVRSRIFEPFFTTKEKGKGSGLGLSTVYGIVNQSDGFIWVYSEPGHGTTFKIYLPQVKEIVGNIPVSRYSLEETRGSETILLVEDEDVVRTLAREILKSSGYTVLVAASGEEALRVCERYSEPIDLMLTDVVMPKMSGRELAERMARLRPETKVLYMSGYTDDAIVHHGVLDEGIAFLQKPFTVNRLTRKVRETLDERR